MFGRGKKKRTSPNLAQRASTSTAGRRPRSLPSQYDFTPAAERSPQLQTPASEDAGPPLQSTAAHVRNYPPPLQLFQHSGSRQPEVQRSASVEVQNNLANQAATTQQVPPAPQQDPPPSQQDPPPSAVQESRAHSHPSSQGNNFEEYPPLSPDLQEDTLQSLNDLLMLPERDKFVTVLSPIPRPNTTWFTRDTNSRLVRNITRVFTNKFDGPYYSWTCVPQERQEKYFLEFAKTHHWDPLITWTVQFYFNEICLRRMKGMVSTVRTSRKKPKWIGKTLWKEMTTYWDTEEAQERSQIYSNARMSDRNGLGPHIHFSGSKSYHQIRDELEEQLGKTVSIGDVFIKTHTKPDGTYVDRKAEKIAELYQKNLQLRQSELEAEASAVSDGTSRVRELKAEECTTIFLQSTERESRGVPYGVGSLKESLVNGKQKQAGDSTSFVALQEQLLEAQRKIEEQVSYNQRREAENSRAANEQKKKLEHLFLVEKFLREKDPRFLNFLVSHSAKETTTDPISPSPAASPSSSAS